MGRRILRPVVAVVTVTVVIFAAGPGWGESASASTAHSDQESTSLAQGAEDDSLEAKERLAEEMMRVLSLRDAPDSMCLSVRLDDQFVFESKVDLGLVPASLMKIVTAAAALEVMRPDESYRTAVFVRADALEAVSDGVLTGDIYLIGAGDPVLSTPRYIGRFPEAVAFTDMTQLAERVFATLVEFGISRVEGRLVGDDSWYSSQERDYANQLFGESATTVWKPSFVTFNTVGQLSGLLLNDGYSSYSGTTSSAGRRLNVRAVDPAKHAASVFDDLLEARGMVITRRPVSAVAPSLEQRTLLGTIDSPPLSDIIMRMLSGSDNTTAEMLLKEIGRRTLGSDRASATLGVQEILEEKLGLLAEGLVIADGSGLSSHNRMTCAAIVELLGQAGRGSPLVEGLSVVGERGTLRWCRPAVAGQSEDNAIRGKTGTLNQSTALAGTSVAANGETVTLAMMVNRPYTIDLGYCNNIHRAVLNATARYTYRTLSPNAPVHSGDRDILMVLYNATGGDSWFNAWGWGTDASLDRWHGVTTDESGRVTAIDLDGPFGNGMTGRLPNKIGALSELTRLELSGNDLTGSLPLGISELSQLVTLGLSDTGVCAPASLESWRLWFEASSKGSVPICTSFLDSFRTTHAEPIESLAKIGVLAGTECFYGYICPDDAIDRATFAVWMTRVLDDSEPAARNNSRFVDVGASRWWSAHVERLAELNITVGCAIDTSRYCPYDGVGRIQMAVFVARGLELLSDSLEQEIDPEVLAGLNRGCAVGPLRSCHDESVTRGEAAAILARVHGVRTGVANGGAAP